MNNASKALLASLSLLGLAACGSGDVAQAIGTADPQVRFAQVAPNTQSGTLQRNGVTRSEATNVPYGFISDYFTVDTGGADWTVILANSSANAGSATSTTTNFDSQRGHKYTILSVQESTGATSVATINDPTNLSLTSDNSRVRVFNGSFNAQNIDVYLNAVGQNINSMTPNLSGIGFKQTGPGNGTDSLSVAGSANTAPYQITITAAGTKTVLFQGQQVIPNSRDLLFVTVPSSATNPTGINLLVKTDGQGPATQVQRL